MSETAKVTFDSAAFIAQRNAATKVIPQVAKPEPVVEQATEPVVEAPKPHLNRAARRLREQLAEERGRRMALESFVQNGNRAQVEVKQQAPVVDQEPNRNDFKTDAEYAAAIARYHVKQETGKISQENEVLQAIKQEYQEANASQEEHVKLIPNWEKVVKGAEKLDLAGQEFLPGMLATSDVRAFVVEYLVDNPKDWERLISYKGDAIKQRDFFKRIEGKVEVVYDKRKAEQAALAEKSEKGPEKTEQVSGKTAAPVKVLPKPSSEVSAKGGTAPPSEPAVGSAAWMAQRNAAKRTSRY